MIHKSINFSRKPESPETLGSKRYSLQAVELSQRTQAAVQIVSNLPAPSNGGPIYRSLGMRTRWMAGAAAKYLDLPSTQRIQTHTSHRHNTTSPLPTLVQALYPLPTYTTATKTQTHVQHSPCPHRVGKAQT